MRGINYEPQTAARNVVGCRPRMVHILARCLGRLVFRFSYVFAVHVAHQDLFSHFNHGQSERNGPDVSNRGAGRLPQTATVGIFLLSELRDRFMLIDVRAMRQFVATGKAHAMTSRFQCFEQVVCKCESLIEPCCRCGYIDQLSFVRAKQLPLFNLIAPFIKLLRTLYETVNSSYQASCSCLRRRRCGRNGPESGCWDITILRPEQLVAR